MTTQAGISSIEKIARGYASQKRRRAHISSKSAGGSRIIPNTDIGERHEVVGEPQNPNLFFTSAMFREIVGSTSPTISPEKDFDTVPPQASGPGLSDQPHDKYAMLTSKFAAQAVLNTFEQVEDFGVDWNSQVFWNRSELAQPLTRENSSAEYF